MSTVTGQPCASSTEADDRRTRISTPNASLSELIRTSGVLPALNQSRQLMLLLDRALQAKESAPMSPSTVSYTHLTLPTIYSV